jgi:hypothetical protein
MLKRFRVIATLQWRRVIKTDRSKDGKLGLLTGKNSVLVLVDYQPSMFKSVSSGDKTVIKSAAICAAKAARILGVPVVLSSINPKSLGDFIPEIAARHQYLGVITCLH